MEFIFDTRFGHIPTISVSFLDFAPYSFKVMHGFHIASCDVGWPSRFMSTSQRDLGGCGLWFHQTANTSWPPGFFPLHGCKAGVFSNCRFCSWRFWGFGDRVPLCFLQIHFPLNQITPGLGYFGGMIVSHNKFNSFYFTCSMAHVIAKHRHFLSAVRIIKLRMSWS